MPELAQHSTPIFNTLPPSLYVGPSDDPPSSPSSPPATAQSGGQGSAIPPVIDPTAWEDFPVFRETFLLYITDPAYNAALRIFGRLLHELVLEYYRHWPNWLEGVTATELRAAVADLRHLEGYLGAVGREHEEASLTEPEMALSRLAARHSGELTRIADEIEQALGGVQ
jgi:hypothetical protein